MSAKRSLFERMTGYDKSTMDRIGGIGGTYATTNNILALSEQLAAIEARLASIETTLATLLAER